MELHVLEESEQHSSQCNSLNSFETQNTVFEVVKQRDMKSSNDIEQVLNECEKT